MKRNASADLLRTLGVATCLIAGLACQWAFAEPASAKRAGYVTAAATPADEQDRAIRVERKEPARLSKPPRGEGRPLPPQGASQDAAGEKPRDRNLKPGSGLAAGRASLAIVLGLFLAAAWAVRRGLPMGSARLPTEAVEVLGRTPLAGRQFAHLIRCGNKLLLVHLAPGCAETLTEITDPVEVDRLAGLCRQAHPQSSTSSFRQVFQQWGKKND
jgi:flagellar protein FliO/FliZ